MDVPYLWDEHACTGGEKRDMLPSSVPLTPAQAVRVHGWFNPSRRLDWATVRSRGDLDFCTLYRMLCGKIVNASSPIGSSALDSLFTLQPSFKEWVSERKVSLVDCEVMHRRWVIKPLEDFGPGRIKVGEILQAGLSCSALKGCGVTVDRLVDVGMTPGIMALFRFTLEEWLSLGLGRRHVETMTHAQVEEVFGATKNVLEASLRCA